MDAMLVYQYWVNVFFLFQCCSLRPPRKTLLYIHKVNSKMEKRLLVNKIHYNITKQKCNYFQYSFRETYLLHLI